jgi:hypothetical protein
MAQLQVILMGENWKRRILVGLVLCVLGLILLEIWNPGTMASIYSAARTTVVWIYDFIVKTAESLHNLARSIGLIR